MNERYDVIVIGIGAMGAATCSELARRGTHVLGLEQHGIPHSLGSSHGESRVIRICYYENPEYVPLLRRTYELFDQLEQDSGERLHVRTGALYMGDEECDLVRGALRTAHEHDLTHEMLSHQEVIKRYPQFRLPDNHVGVWEPQAGYLLPEASICAMTRVALEHGAQIHGHEPVIDWEEHGSHVTVRTERGSYEAGQVVFCAGAWTNRILGEIGVPLEVARHVLAWVWPGRPERFTADSFPVWGLDDPDGFFYYGFPLQPGRVGLKAARHYRGEPVSLDALDRMPRLKDEQEIRAALTRYLPDADGPVLSMSVCMYTNSPDGHFIIDRHPTCPRAVIATGFSGHGFKFAPVVGEILSDLVLEGSTSLPADFLKLSRFGK